MRVRLCARCPYTPRDVTGHYDPEAVLYLCAKCDSEHEVSSDHYPRKAERTHTCTTVPNIFATAQSRVAGSATESLASYGTIPSELRYVQGSALIGSGHVRKPTANGYPSCARPDKDYTWHRAHTGDSGLLKKGVPRRTSSKFFCGYLCSASLRAAAQRTSPLG
jgi:hypothetical protein